MPKPTISACVIMHDDYDALQEALSSIIDVVDEIVVVDGAYEWIAPFLEAVGRDPSRSEEDALRIVEEARAVKPIVYVSGVWRNELDKRVAAYERCSGDYVYLIDSDEIHALDREAFERFASSDTAVAMAASPLYADGQHVGVEPGREAGPLKPVLFKRADITAQNHLAYLWLVLTPEERQSLGPMERAKMFLDAPVATNHHLSNLRSLRTSCNRAAFYCLLANRSLGRMGWWGHEEVSPEKVTQTLLSRIESGAFYDMLRGHNIAMGFDPASKATFAPYPADSRSKALIDRVAARQRRESAGSRDPGFHRPARRPWPSVLHRRNRLGRRRGRD